MIRIKAVPSSECDPEFCLMLGLAQMDQSRQWDEHKPDEQRRGTAPRAAIPTFEHWVRRRRRPRRSGPTVSWYGRLLIAGALLVAAGWEVFRLLLTLITLD
ncbi:hypothetical protein [Bradyrhizobium sp. USDA 3256]